MTSKSRGTGAARSLLRKSQANATTDAHRMTSDSSAAVSHSRNASDHTKAPPASAITSRAIHKHGPSTPSHATGALAPRLTPFEQLPGFEHEPGEHGEQQQRVDGKVLPEHGAPFAQLHARGGDLIMLMER